MKLRRRNRILSRLPMKTRMSLTSLTVEIIESSFEHENYQPTDIIRRSGLERSYVYHILNGERKIRRRAK